MTSMPFLPPPHREIHRHTDRECRLLKPHHTIKCQQHYSLIYRWHRMQRVQIRDDYHSISFNLDTDSAQNVAVTNMHMYAISIQYSM